MALFAEGILKLHWDQSVPVNLARIAKGMGIVVVLSEDLEPCARLEISPQNKARLVIGKRQSSIRQRYGVAHAMGHLALHHLRPGGQRLIDVADNFGVDQDSRIDSEANQFALGLLMPSQVLEYCVRDMGMANLQELAELFDVAPILVKQRLADLDIRLHPPLAQPLDPVIDLD
ncbi:MAG: ImmA/IrrE family metallo-endopeptidase [Burkholderiaceae bacterium]|nr:ImmA/IrrE family metallo-endopeptidase [Burkholderiaceae bacterium]